MAFVSTLGASDANSYLSVAKATTLLSELPESPGIVAWLALTTTQQEQSLVAATMTINPLQWKGQPSSTEQSLAWPRRIIADYYFAPEDELPVDFEIGVAYMAAFLGTTGGYTGIPDADGGAKRYKNSEYEEVELGDGELRVKFRTDSMSQTGALFIPPFSMDIFSRYMIRGDFYQPRVRRESTARVGYRGFVTRQKPSGVRYINGQLWPYGSSWSSRF
ncbi:MAG: DnaT-like ssDNA-binding protein [bacterium]